MEKLPVRPIPFPDESPGGYLVRACECNGFPSVVTMAHRLCESAYGEQWVLASYTRPERYDEILRAYGLARPEASALCYTRMGPTSDSPRAFEGRAIAERFFDDECRTFCPMCLAARKYFRKRWSLLPYAVCLEHSLSMQTDCYVCKRPLSPLRGALCRCECGASLLDAPRIPSDPEPVDWWLRQVGMGGQRAQEVEACLHALLNLVPSVAQPTDMVTRLYAAKRWLEQNIVSDGIQALIDESIWHPRIAVLPLLESPKPIVQELGNAILRGVSPWLDAGNPDDELLLNRRQAELALGVSQFQMTKMHQQGVLTKLSLDSTNGTFSGLAAHKLLCRLASSGSNAEGVPRSLTRSIGSVISAILDGREVSAGYPMAEGLRTLRSIAQSTTTVPSATHDEIDVHETAKIMNTYPEAIRFLAKAGWLEHRTRDRLGRKRFVADRAVVMTLAEKYVLAGEIAAQAGVSVTSTSERVMAMGVRAVSGPKIDGALVYMFERDAVAGIDLSKLKDLKDYPTSTGRKREGEKRKAQRSEMPLAEAAAVLGVNVQTAKRLVVSQHLQEIANQERQVFVTRRSVTRLRETLDDAELIPIEDAAARLGMKTEAFEVTYVRSGIVLVHDLGVSRRVHESDIKLVRNMRERYLTADEAGRVLKQHRSHLPNLERRGEIKSIQFGKARTVKFYAVTDVQRLKPVGAPRAADGSSLDAEVNGGPQQSQAPWHGGTHESH
ncbi:TniQ family protein [Cupriavidus pinatubonensis]|uniref:TniQ domain-containing protein n=1 Tax=Cupriavidus pinatubonensis TaxID=248026 RepID=A0ABM8XKC1_9BURK|nr:TniQ family protein [Cupriavidus pinatubonensis]CAG9180658.1 hypothetical protein LMG23994_04470 [Cupriavidus pinatubonensis]